MEIVHIWGGALEAGHVHDEHAIRRFVVASDGREMPGARLTQDLSGVAHHETFTFTLALGQQTSNNNRMKWAFTMSRAYLIQHRI